MYKINKKLNKDIRKALNKDYKIQNIKIMKEGSKSKLSCSRYLNERWQRK